MERAIIVGAGLAGLRTAEALRAQGYQGRLTLVGAEPHEPYDRPPLSKAVLAGTVEDTTVPADWEALRCETLFGHRATALGDGVLETTAGRLDFDGLVLATGATPVRLPGDGQHLLRTIEDARALRAGLRPGARVAIVGAGWIGAEVATAAAAAGCRVTVVEAADAPLANAIGGEVGSLTAPWYAAAGVELLHGLKVAQVTPRGLDLADGGALPADVVVVGIGVRPDVAWLADSGLAIERGIVVDEHLRTSLTTPTPASFSPAPRPPAPAPPPSGKDRPPIVAVGDCAAWWSRRFGRRLLVEHWDTALNAPEVAASSLLGGDAVYDAVPYFWSEQFGHMVQYAGHHPAADRMIHRGDPAGTKWSVCWLAGDRIVGILTVNRPRDLAQGRRIIAGDRPIDEERLADPEVAVREAVRQ